ncbi:hypothetical protein [Methanoregula sp.]|uniref:hypothetical protein n=1 Tax=Methanoregula sp. TaxID=2052170 RepID=UPI003568072D
MKVPIHSRLQKLPCTRNAREFRKAEKALLAMAVKLRRPDEKTHECEYYTVAVTQSSDPEMILEKISLDGINEARGGYCDIGFSHIS